MKEKANVPELRFPEFQGDWEIKSLSSIGLFIRGITYSSDDVCQKGLLVLRSSNIQNETLILDKDLVFINKEVPSDLLVKKGDVVISMSNGSKTLVGKNAEYKGDYPDLFTIGAFCSIFRTKSEYARLIFKTENYKNFIEMSISGGNINNLRHSALEKFYFPIPLNTLEQQKIADCLSSLDDLITAQTEKITALQTYKKGLMQQLFPQEGESVPKLRFGNSNWEIECFNDLYTFKNTNTFSRDQLNYTNGIVKNIHYGDIHKKFSTLFDIGNEMVPYINNSEVLDYINDESYCREGDIIFVDASENLEDIGKHIEIVNLSGFKVLSGLHTILARPKKDNMIIGFGGYLLGSEYIRNQIKKESQGTKVLGISAKRLSTIEIAFPVDKDEQQKIADCLSSLDKKIAKTNEKLTVLLAHKKGLMQKLFPVVDEAN